MLTEAQVRERMQQNPDMNTLIKQLTEERVKEELTKLGILSGTGKSRGKGLVKHSNKSKHTRENSPQFSRMKTTPDKAMAKQNKVYHPNGRQIKSPSDTMLYMLALKQAKQSSNQADRLINQISDFVENIRLETEGQESRFSSGMASSKRRHLQDKGVQPEASTSQESAAKECADSVILGAGKFKAQILAPTGMELVQKTPQIGEIIQNPFLRTPVYNNVETDDNFFHVTCHIESSLCEKIEKGEYVDLECLLPKSGLRNGNEGRMEIVSKDGMTFFTPVQDKGGKITGIRKWEQAFRVYAAIYSKANPQRASEIWQYVHVVNLAAASYSWENVSFYDFTFRQLMSIKLNRSWVKTYVQGWNLAMTEQITKTQSTVNATNQGRFGNKTGGHKNWKDFCCWKFNKNRCNHTDCEWDHRCTYCGGWNHSFADCRKRKKEGRGDQDRAQGGSPQKHRRR